TAPVQVPVSLTGFDAASNLVAIVSVPEDGGSLTLMDGDQGGQLTSLYGYGGFDSLRVIGFQGSRATVEAALASKLYWDAPLNAAPSQLEVVVAEYQAGTFYNPANGNYYMPVAQTLSWSEALAQA